MAMIPAAIYARYSSHAQNDESIEQQLAECEAYASAHGLQIVATYADRAMSGRNDRRPEFHQMQLIQTLARVGRVFVMSVSRPR